MKHKKLYITFSIIFAVMLVAVITHRPWLEGIARFLIVEDELSPADAIVVLGGGGTERVRHSVKLYQSGHSAQIIMTGMTQSIPGVTTTWARFAMQEAVSLAAPEDAIILEEKATNTSENAEYVKEIMIDRNLKSAIIVSSPYHMRRARMIFRKEFEDREDISLQFSSVEDSNFKVQGWWTRKKDFRRVAREYRTLFVCLFR